MSQDAPDTIGRRVARARKLRGLTQHGLAGRSNYSRSLIAQVEAGHKAPTGAFVAAMSAALGVDPARLYGQPFQEETEPDRAVYAPLSEIRRVLTVTDVAPDLDGPPRPIAALAAELATAQRLRHASQHAKLGARLPALLAELMWHAYEEDEPSAWRMLHTAHSITASLTRRLGFTDLASMVQERSAVSALRSQDPHLPLMVTHRRALLMMAVAAWAPAVKLLRRSMAQVDLSRADAVEVLGSLHLRAAIVSARNGDASSAWEHFGQAEEVSERAGRPSLDEHGTDFNPGNLVIHGAAISAELRDYDDATRRDARISKAMLVSLAPERRAHHGIDMARVRMELGDRRQALERLLTAEKDAPQMVRYHPMARATARCLADSHRDVPERLRGLLTRMG
ncbi:helix-turn-helix domain-containing protein [Nocardiopsis sp. NPDC101807]|uniref:helix-turn-helix domain-containing protein n=1 Tax=Nocardiopsis sp. NPDC101807 TaxID=3364339 RepID=UPI00382DFF42